MNILVAPDKFKGSLTAVQVCEAIETGIKRHDPDAVVMMHPLADGGEGTLDVLDAAMQLETEYLVVNDPLFRPIKAFYKRNRDTAFIEMAVASGLEILETDERNCLNTSTLGTGELMLHAISNGISTIYLFIGGSATNDGGMGLARQVKDEISNCPPTFRTVIFDPIIDLASIRSNSPEGCR